MSLSVNYGRELQTLDARGPRGGLTRERAMQIVELVTSGAKLDYERVILSTWAFSVDAAEVFAGVFSKLDRLESAVLADIIAGRPEVEGLAVYRTLGAALQQARLKEIDLSDNAMGLKGIDACRGLLENQEQLERLFFCNCGISAEAGRAIADIMLYRKPTRLTTLHFDNNMSGGGGACAVADIVAASPSLLDFRFSSSRGTREGGVALARAFALTTSIASINLHDNLFAEVLGPELSRSLRNLSSLVHLDVGDTLLKDAGMIALASGLVRGPAATLEHLDVSANELTPKGAAGIARILRRCPKLVTVRLEDNEWENEGACIIASRGLAARSVVRAKAAEKGNVDAAIPDPLAHIVLSGCMIQNHGGSALARSVAALPALAVLDLGGNNMTSAGLETVRAMLAKNVILGDVDDQDANDDDDEDEEGEESSPVSLGLDEDGVTEDDSDVEEEFLGDDEVDALASAIGSKIEL